MVLHRGPLLHSARVYLRAVRLDRRRGGPPPWTIQGLLPVNVAISSLSAGAVKTTFFLFLAIFALFLFIEIRIMLGAIRKGPQITED